MFVFLPYFISSLRQERNKLKEEVTKLQKLLSESESGTRRKADSNSDATSTETVDFTAEKENLQRQVSSPGCALFIYFKTILSD